MQPGFNLTGFADTALEAFSYWYDKQTAVLPGWEPPYTLQRQENPQAMVDVMVQVITGERTTCHNVFPPAMEDEVEAWQAEEWSRTV